MRRLAILLLIGVAASAVGCAWTPEERQKFIDDVSHKAAVKAADAFKDKVAPEIKAKIADILADVVDKLELPADAKAEILKASVTVINETIDSLMNGEIVAAKVEEMLKDMLDKILPEGEPGGSAEGVGGAIGSVLYGLLMGALGLKKGGAA